MGILSIGCYSYSSSLLSKLIGVPQNYECYPSRRKTNVVYCQGGGNVIKSSGLSSMLTERSSLVGGTDHAAATLMDAGSLVLSQSGKSQAEIVVKDLVPYGGPTSTTLIGLEDGIGIVKFLRGKKFFITGATGFLAKGICLI